MDDDDDDLLPRGRVGTQQRDVDGQLEARAMRGTNGSWSRAPKSQ